jgi:hypothetical protein
MNCLIIKLNRDLNTKLKSKRILLPASYPNVLFSIQNHRFFAHAVKYKHDPYSLCA